MNKITHAIAALALIFSIGCATTGKHLSQKAGSQQPYQMDKKVEVKIGYHLFLPEGYDADKAKEWPLIFFLHGAGERGDDLAKVLKHGPPKLVQESPGLPFVIVSPQCPNGRFWDNFTLLALLDDVIAKCRIDESRIYLTGLSMGGYGTWSLASNYPDRFAAIAPICGGGNPRRAVWFLKNMPIWVFHGAKDTTVPLSQSQDMVDALKKAGSDVRFTVYPEANHDSWTETYNNPELYTWFLSHKKEK